MVARCIRYVTILSILSESSAIVCLRGVPTSPPSPLQRPPCPVWRIRWGSLATAPIRRRVRMLFFISWKLHVLLFVPPRRPLGLVAYDCLWLCCRSSEGSSSGCEFSNSTVPKPATIGRTYILKNRFRDSLSQPSPVEDSVTSVSSPESPWSTSTEGSSSTPPQRSRSQQLRGAQPPPEPFSLREAVAPPLPPLTDHPDRPYHNWMRDRLRRRPCLEGYGWDKQNKAP